MSSLSHSLRNVIGAVPGAFLTAVVTILLVVFLSTILGGEQRALFAQSVSNAQEVVDHAQVMHCEMAYLVEIVKVIGDQSPNLDLDSFPEINTEGLDCETIIGRPFIPGPDPAPAPPEVP